VWAHDIVMATRSEQKPDQEPTWQVGAEVAGRAKNEALALGQLAEGIAAVQTRWKQDPRYSIPIEADFTVCAR
jgi:hypothetical protein